jgi:6,7-dimethyl-8-ribityllumazine synthase
MASEGNKTLLEPVSVLNTDDATVVVVKTAWNSHITDALNEGCKRVLAQSGVRMLEYTVPGAVELTFAINHLAGTLPDVDAFIVLGCIIKGDTPHFEFVCMSVTQGITQLNTQLQKPVIFGVLTVNTGEQANERIGGIHGHKGEEAGLTALQMIDFMRRS